MWSRIGWSLLPFAVALALWLPGIGWGLPTRASDRSLFGDRTPWTGRELIDLLPKAEDAARGADVDATPLAASTRPITLNATDADRAIIVRRYRLQSRQPDEFINFKAIAEMARRGDYDPRLYQYGGLWIYPLAAALKAAGAIGLIELRADPTFYLDHPEAFGRFYVVGRLMSVAWGLLGVWAVGRLCRELGGGQTGALAAAVAFASLPIVVNAAHEAKPHLAGASMMLVAAWLATVAVRREGWRSPVALGIACAAATSLVVTGVMSSVLLTVVAICDRGTGRRWAGRLTVSIAAALLTWAVFNPMTARNVLFRRELLTNNLGNSTAMYAVGFGGLDDAARMLLFAGNVILIAAILAIAVGRKKFASIAVLPIAFLAVTVLLQFALLADGKPMEYARFAIVPLSAAVVLGAATLRTNFQHAKTLVVAVAAMTVPGIWTTVLYLVDGGPPESYVSWSDHRELLLAYEPAPWSMAPVDLFERQLLLSPDRKAPGVIGPIQLASQMSGSPWRETFCWAPATYRQFGTSANAAAR